MGIVKYAVLEADCEFCGLSDRADYLETASKYDYAKELRRLGWKVSKDGRQCICPDCIKKGKKLEV